MKSKLIAISAISAGFIAIFLTVGAYVQVADLFVLVVSSVFTLMPLHHKSYKASILAYLAGGVIAFLFSGFNLLSVVFPAYFAYFGIYPVIKQLMLEKKVNKIVCTVIGLVWCVVAVFGIYFYYTFVMHEVFTDIEWLANYIYPILGLISVVFYFVFDYSLIMVKRVMDNYLNRISK